MQNGTEAKQKLPRMFLVLWSAGEGVDARLSCPATFSPHWVSTF